MCLVDTNFYDLGELSSEWKACSGKLKKWLITGALKPHIWLPVLIVLDLNTSVLADGMKAKDYSHYEGFAPLSDQHCQRLFRSGKLSLRDFRSECGQHRYQLPDSSDDILVTPDDLFILETNKQDFEQQYLEISGGEQTVEPTSDLDFRILEFEGETYRFGSVQSAILRVLHKAVLDGEPWQNGKRLLHAAGSESFTISNVFKHKPIWKQLIQSDARGHYRLAPAFVSQL